MVMLHGFKMATTETETQNDAKTYTFATRYETKDMVDFDESRTYGDWRDEFHKKGCVLIRNLLSREKAEYYRPKQLQWLKNFELGFDENDRSTWNADHLPVSFKGGMYFAYGSAHEKFAWEARTEPAIIDVFEKLWETKELICSFDGMNVFPPRNDLNWSSWPHCDQNPERKGMQAVQGLANFAPNGPNDGGLVLMGGSAKLFNEFFAQKQIKFMDLFLFNKNDVKWFEDRGCTFDKIDMEPGDFVLWDSRTMHMAKFPEGDQIRHAQYICMTPRNFATEEALKTKKYCFENFMGTTHWPHWYVACGEHVIKQVVLTRLDSNIRPASEKPMRNGEVCPKYRTEPFEKPMHNDRLLPLAGVKAY
ncbi:hypothetical protein D0863_04621 [Hortaea werneckii]|uniref:Phytanoyl-CoA dioxygenase n=1 Tax=Hortaea werneckii TaxID=91943 RepID=A0A3M7E8A3_HORWE|nr:hypothetical protein D0863_04621 [Hortaea werneckii]